MLDEPLTRIPGVGEKLAEKLKLLGLNTISDLLFYVPLRYEDHTKISSLKEAVFGIGIQIFCKIVSVQTKSTRNGSLLEVNTRENNTNTPLQIVFWHLYPNQIKEFVVGKYVLCFGTVENSTFGYSMKHPDYWIVSKPEDLSLPSLLTPIYSVTKGVRSEKISQLVKYAIDCAQKEGLEELLPEEDTNNITLLSAVKFIHLVPSDYNWNSIKDGSSPYIQRISLEELTANTAAVYIARSQNSKFSANPMPSKNILRRELLSKLGFNPTKAQSRVTQEIDTDMAQSTPMLRLLQGDVGSGKTLVAALSALNATENGYQTAIMAPTEILASQHYQKFSQLLTPLGVQVVLLNGRLKTKERRETVERIANGEAQIVIGTHALFQEQVEFNNLSFIIIDEQHRFGVEQRLKLLTKGQKGNKLPHQLIMTATPIPRTLAMTNYADLNVSSIDELPPGRKPITTKLITINARQKLLERIEDVCLNKKWQVYWVCPLIEESEVLDCAAAEKEYEELQKSIPSLKIGMVHGRIPGDEKQQIMEQFKKGELDMLVATTVIEVGVDVPNANIIVIEDPQRLGLAQLHQLRGRVGRGQQQAFCMLYCTSDLSATARERLEFLCKTNDGLEIAQKDLEIRGPGEYLGTKQTGVAGMRVAEFLRDQNLIPSANKLAKKITNSDVEIANKLIKRWTKADSGFTQT